MADVSKAQKLASARKKFKELKKEKKRNATQKQDDNNSSIQSSRELTPVESIDVNTEQQNEPQHVTQLPNYFNENYETSPQSVTFFDNFQTTTTLPPPTNNEAINFFNQPNQVPYFSETPPTNANQSEIDCLQENPITDFVEVDNQKEELLETQELVPHSNIESLKQLSSEMAELINQNFEENLVVNKESDLELRNQELAGIVEHEKLKNDQLNAVLQEYQAKIVELENIIKEKDLHNADKHQEDLNKLQDELKNHTQTIGILVGENAELQANLNQFKLTTKQQIDECEELQGRLKTSRSRVTDLEREIQHLKNEKTQIVNSDQNHSNLIDQLQYELNQFKLDKDELNQDLLEVREKLKTSSQNNLELQKQINELNGQLSMANIKIQQLSTGRDDEKVEQLTQEKFVLEKQVSDLNAMVKNMMKERDESNLQYQQYAQQLNNQLANLANRLDQTQKENESLQIQEQNRIKHIEELERQLQNLQNEHISFSVHKTSSEMKTELDKSLDAIEKLQAQINDLHNDNQRILTEKNDLFKQLEMKEANLKQLEENLIELRENQPDNTKLLATMESDKIAASRAIIQNTELKNQMDSMQEVFDKLNNDKIDLIEKLTIEQYNNKELIDKLQKTELHLKTLADAIEIKDKELYELNKQILQDEQLNDRLRHYEAQDHSGHVLQDELQKAQMIINELRNEIERLSKRDANNEIINELGDKLQQLELNNQELQTKLQQNDDDGDDNILDKESAMKHLEEKVLKTMDEIAVLTDEKQRLEHLVLQLQSETETIDEYVALYQQQRSVLKQRSIEKDLQLKQLENDREQMKSKLEKLNNLINKFVINHDGGLLEANDNIKINNNGIDNCDNNDHHHHHYHKSVDTVDEIVSLLSEIKNSNLVQPTEDIHHCPCCSGQLITV